MRRTVVVMLLAALSGGAVGLAAQTALPIDGAAQVHALAQAYPNTIDEVAFRDGDWAVRIAAEWFYWSNGRMLPQKARKRWEHYAPLRFTTYRTGPIELPPVSAREEVLLSEWIPTMEEEMPGRHNGFHGALYGIMRPSQASRTMVVARLFGFPVRVHPLIVGPLHAVDRDVAAARRIDPALDRFIDSLVEIGGFHWRPIAGSESLSLHAYGVAVDLVPEHYARRFVYWRWAAVAGVSRWWAIPLEERLSIPPRLVEIFERHGFIWGGRWVFFDQIHFEYRPEVLALTGPGR